MAGDATLEGKNGDIALEMLTNITNLLDENHIDYWLEGGTLLGIIRENRLLPWDNDIDLSIKEEEFNKVAEIINKSNYRIRYREFEKDDSPFVKGVTRQIKIRNYKYKFFRGDVVLEIFVKFRKDEQYFWQVGPKKKSVPAYFYDKLAKFSFNSKEYLVPAQYKEYLTFRYGDWETPVKEWDTFTDDKAVL